VWTRDGRLLSRTQTTPAEPINPTFEPGFHSHQVAGRVWRTYTLYDESGDIQVQMGEHVEQRMGIAKMDSLSRLLNLSWLLLLLSASLIAVLLWSSRPLARLQQQIEVRKLTDASALDSRGLPLEVQPLVLAFNALLERAETARTAQRRFVADAAHELRTPLAALRLQTQVAMRAVEPAEQQAALARLLQGIDRSTRLVEQLLDVARFDAPTSAQALQDVNVMELCQRLTESCAALAVRRRVSLHLDTELQQVRAAPGLLEVAMRNLLDNALRYSPEGSTVTLGTQLLEGRACFYVSDQGPGLDAAQQELALRPFVRLGDGLEMGSGLGLSIVHRVVALMGAELRLEHRPPAVGLKAMLLL
jgi:two-component system sensor histidine kinase QseC